MPSEKQIKQLLGPESYAMYTDWRADMERKRQKEEGLYACATCGEPVRRYGQRCDQCKRSMEEDRLERESNR